ncbi:MAG: hypothetical protein KAI28_08900 [Sphingomonadales bacterium]|nr:hypothetical protein [Sphingomonadales bacterium]
MNRSFHIFAVLILVIAVGGIYQLKHMVEAEQRLLQTMRRQYVEDQKAIRVLRAEWAYLNSPEYLEDLAAKHLDLTPTRPTQVAADVESLPIQTESVGKLAGLGGIMPRAKPTALDGHVPFWTTATEGGGKP